MLWVDEVVILIVVGRVFFRDNVLHTLTRFRCGWTLSTWMTSISIWSLRLLRSAVLDIPVKPFALDSEFCGDIFFFGTRGCFWASSRRLAALLCSVDKLTFLCRHQHNFITDRFFMNLDCAQKAQISAKVSDLNQKSPGIRIQIYGFIRIGSGCLANSSQNFVDSLYCRRQSFRRVS